MEYSLERTTNSEGLSGQCGEPPMKRQEETQNDVTWGWRGERNKMSMAALARRQKADRECEEPLKGVEIDLRKGERQLGEAAGQSL